MKFVSLFDRNYNFWKRCALFLAISYAALLFFPSSLSAAASKGSLVFTVSLDKTEYTADEAINVIFVLKNQSKKSIYVNKRFLINSQTADKSTREVSLAVTSPSGTQMEFKYPGESGYPKSDYFELLEPGKEIKSEYPRNLRGNFEMTEPGVYTLTAVYQNTHGSELGLDVFKERLAAPAVKFTIKGAGK